MGSLYRQLVKRKTTVQGEFFELSPRTLVQRKIENICSKYHQDLQQMLGDKRNIVDLAHFREVSGIPCFPQNPSKENPVVSHGYLAGLGFFYVGSNNSIQSIVCRPK